MDRKRQVGDKVWAFSTMEPGIIGPLVIDRVLPDGQAHHYHAREVHSIDAGQFYLRDDNCGTQAEAKQFAFNFWLENLEKKRREVDAIIKGMVKLAISK